MESTSSSPSWNVLAKEIGIGWWRPRGSGAEDVAADGHIARSDHANIYMMKWKLQLYMLTFNQNISHCLINLAHFRFSQRIGYESISGANRRSCALMCFLFGHCLAPCAYSTGSRIDAIILSSFESFLLYHALGHLPTQPL